MRLNRLTPATRFDIKSPIWNGGERKIGLDLKRITKHNVINITYRRKDGTLSFPDEFYFNGDKLAETDYERMNIKGLTLVLVPLSDLDTIERVS